MPGREDRIGSLEIGKQADVLVLTDILEVERVFLGGEEYAFHKRVQSRVQVAGLGPNELAVKPESTIWSLHSRNRGALLIPYKNVKILLEDPCGRAELSSFQHE